MKLWGFSVALAMVSFVSGCVPSPRVDQEHRELDPIGAAPIAAHGGRCPTPQRELSCSSSVTGLVDLDAVGQLSNYACGAPYAPTQQTAPEDVHVFRCQNDGEVTMRFSDLGCDLDFFVLGDHCDPDASCVVGATDAETSSTSLTFTCLANEDYLIVVEAFGATVSGAGECSRLSDPTYRITFDVGSGTGCSEDCDDEMDNDLDTMTDCEDPDCASDLACNCDRDEDGFDDDGVLCGGTDCDDRSAAINPFADDIPDDGIDQDCDGADATSDAGTPTDAAVPMDVGPADSGPFDAGAPDDGGGPPPDDGVVPDLDLGTQGDDSGSTTDVGRMVDLGTSGEGGDAGGSVRSGSGGGCAVVASSHLPPGPSPWLTLLVALSVVVVGRRASRSAPAT